MKVGLIGLSGVGKTTLFNALTRSDATLNAYGGQSNEVHLGTVPVPDPRFDFAVSTCHPKKITPATLDITDGGARVASEEKRDKFGSDFFAGVRNMDALVLVVRAFPDPLGLADINPAAEARGILEELLIADLSVIESRMEKLEKGRLLKRQTPAEAAEQQVLIRIKAHLDELQPVRKLDLEDEEERAVRSFAFVSGKPIILVVNLPDEPQDDEAEILASVQAIANEEGLQLISLRGKVEMEVSQMEPEEEREFLHELGIEEPARDRLIRAAYGALGQICFFTVGDDETRAWTIKNGTTALGAAEKIHTDIARTFIRAETIGWGDFEAAGGWDEAKAAGKIRLEGKEYIVKDGDCVHIRNSKG